uniref:Farnesyl diphosphate synthase n=1 Tax=Kalanchoe fedtschenkoi TaxID=63787 RepID=A0A7N0UXU9_KALFE
MGDVRKSAIDMVAEFMKLYPVLKPQLLQDPAFECADDSRQWVDRMLDYHVPRGEKALFPLMESYQILKEGKELTEQEFFITSALGCCVEWLHAYFLVLKDVTANSNTKRGQPSSFTVPKDGMINANDGLFLRNHIPRILKRRFSEKPYYVDLIHLFNEVEFKTASGLMLDFITTTEGVKDISNYSVSGLDHLIILSMKHRQIVQYKTAYYSFYISAACALLTSGEKLENQVDVMNILVEMGIHYQVQGDTDIEDNKCSWLVVTALEQCNEEQKKVLLNHYGKDNPEDIAKVKALLRSSLLKIPKKLS